MNQEVTEHIEQNEAAALKGSAGERLRQAREARGLSRDDVAAELRLHIKLITALEDNNRAELPPTAFVSGYLRAYARLLDLPADELIASYGSEPASVADYRPTDRSGERVVSSHDPKFRLISFGVAGLLIVLFLLWWANDRYTLISPTQHAQQQSGDASQQESGLPVPPLMQEAAPEQSGNAPANRDGETMALPLPAESTAPTVSPVPKTVMPTVEVTPPAPAVATAPAKPAEEKMAEPSKTAPVVTTEALPPSTPQATLRLEFQSDSWTQVEDAKGRTLAYDLIKSGRTLELHGVAPFKVFLGYAPGVQVSLNGNAFSVTPYLRGELARFRVGGSQDNRPLDR